MAKKREKTPQRRILNKKARHEYYVLQTVEAGISLTGTEVKSLRAGKVSLDEAFARIDDYEVYLIGCNIQTYPPATDRNHDPIRKRKLLLHRREIVKLLPQVKQTGHTLVPLSIFFNSRGLAKVDLGLVVGKTHHDKRETIKKREHKREIDRAMRRR